MISDMSGLHRRMPTTLIGRFNLALGGNRGGQIEYYHWPIQATLRREQDAYSAPA